MMNDRFAVDLRRHLLDTANERPADGELAAIIEQVARTSQRRPVTALLPGLRVPSQVPAAVRYGLLAVLLALAAIAGAIIAGGGAGIPKPSTPFEGTWTAIDPGDGSRLNLSVGVGTRPTVRFEDVHASGAVCIDDESKLFTAEGVGDISGNRLKATFPNGGGCGLATVSVAGTYDYDPIDDILRDQDDVVWTRTPGGPKATQPEPTLVGVASGDPSPGPTQTTDTTPDPLFGPTDPPDCVDLSRGGTYTAPTGGLSVSATIPSSPLIAWAGWTHLFELHAACADPSSITIHPATGSDLFGTSCLPDATEITTFADAIARLDTPVGEDIARRIDLTIDGHPAARYDVRNLSTCDAFGLWDGTLLGRGETGSIYVIDVDGELVEIELNRDGSQTATELDEAYGIVASLRFR